MPPSNGLRKSGEGHVRIGRWLARLDERGRQRWNAGSGRFLVAFAFDAHAAGLWVFAAAVAVATSDTWASEFGCLDDRVRMITTLRVASQA